MLKTDDDAFNVPQRYVDYLLMVDSDEKFIGLVRLRPPGINFRGVITPVLGLTNVFTPFC